jgi:integrase
LEGIMPKRTKELSPLAVSRLKKPGFHNVGGVTGLHLQVTGSGAASWVLRVLIGDRRRDMGLGGYPSVTLQDARERARQARELVWQGTDPIEQRKAARSRLMAEAERILTFEKAAGRYITAHEAGWKNGKHSAQWQSTLEVYVFPVMGKMNVADIQTAHVMKVLEPIWTTKAETAARVRSRIELVLDWATARGHRSGENPARWRGHLDKLLPRRSKVQRVEHHPALPYHETGGFMDLLRRQDGMGALALEFAILTACRSGEVRGATWDEVDLDRAVWTIPSGRMKAGKEHRVPLSKPAVKLLAELPRMAGTNIIFPGRSGKALSDMSMTATLRRMGRPDITAHGFRSSFRDWAGETTAFPREVIEHALAHKLKDKAEAAYARGTLFDKRARLMTEWGRYCSTATEAASVTPIRRKGA